MVKNEINKSQFDLLTCRSRTVGHGRLDLTMDLSLEVKLWLNWQVVTSGNGDPLGGGFGGHKPPWDHFPGTSHLKLHFSVIVIEILE